MREASPQLIALLDNSTGFISCDCLTFTLKGGAGTLRYTSAPVPITVNGQTFIVGPRIERTRTKTQVGVETDELEVNIYPEDIDTIPPNITTGTPWTKAAWDGTLDGALLTVERAFMPSWGDTSPGTIVLFSGRISDVEVSRTAVKMKCRSLLELLSIQMPRRLYQSACNHVFGGEMCGFDRTQMAVSAAALAGSDRYRINFNLTPTPSTLYDGGTITCVGGLNRGYSRTVTALFQGTANLKPGFPAEVFEGDIFTLLPGCNRTFGACRTTFNNEDHFGGFEFIPVAESAA